MNNQQFIAKQTVKYYWKALKHSARITPLRDDGIARNDLFWDYEKTPRVV